MIKFALKKHAELLAIQTAHVLISNSVLIEYAQKKFNVHLIMTVVGMKNVQSAERVYRNALKYARDNHAEDKLLVLEEIINPLVLVLKGFMAILCKAAKGKNVT